MRVGLLIINNPFSNSNDPKIDPLSRLKQAKIDENDIESNILPKGYDNHNHLFDFSHQNFDNSVASVTETDLNKSPNFSAVSPLNIKDEVLVLDVKSVKHIDYEESKQK